MFTNIGNSIVHLIPIYSCFLSLHALSAEEQVGDLQVLVHGNFFPFFLKICNKF